MPKSKKQISQAPALPSTVLAPAPLRRHAFVLIGDTHVNHVFGLMPPSFVTDSGNAIYQNKFQAWLWNCFLNFCALLDHFEVDGILLNGDLPQGINPSRDVELLSINEADQIRFAAQVLQPLLYKFQMVNGAPVYGERRAAKVYAVRGTGFHAGRGGAREELIAQRVGAVADEDGLCSKYEWWIDWRGKIIHATHHTSTATVYPLTPLVRQQNEARVRAQQAHWHMPDVMVRSHIHKTHKHEALDGRLILTTPAWQLTTEFQQKVAPGSLSDIGGIILWLDEEEQIQVRRKVYVPERPRLNRVVEE